MRKRLCEHFKKELIAWRETRSAAQKAKAHEDAEFARLRKVCGFLPELGNKDLIEEKLKLRLAEEYLK